MKKYSAFVFTFICLIAFVFISCESTGVLKAGVREKLSAEYFDIARNYEDLKKYEKAIEYYGYASLDDEYKNLCEFRMARCYALVKDWDNSAALYEKLLLLDEENVALSLSLGYVYANGGKFDESIGIYEKLLASHENDVEIYKNYLSVLVVKGDLEKAKEVFPVMKEKFPDEKSLSTFRSKINTETENSAEKETK